ncbi:MAG: hypothetical protein LBC53_07625 [Spirochaetaceae bacterium]|jgi:hypothetical protein|nr:hypothetical protein [Spirochaetaceae bacterium]
MSAARYLRLRNSAGGVKVEDVLVLIPKGSLEAIKGNEEAPYELIETPPFPSEGMGGLYTGSYFESLLEQMKARPLGGSKTGRGNQNEDFFYYRREGGVHGGKRGGVLSADYCAAVIRKQQGGVFVF